MRESGQKHDTKAIPGLIAILTEKPQVNTDLALTAIHSLAQMGAEDALPGYSGMTTYTYDYGQITNPLLNRSRLTQETTTRGAGVGGAFAYDAYGKQLAGGAAGDPWGRRQQRPFLFWRNGRFSEMSCRLWDQAV